LPRPKDVPKGSHAIHGSQHFRDAHGRFFPLDKSEHGSLRELGTSSDLGKRYLWLNAAYRFGKWVGDLQEHFDVQRAEGLVSPPDIYCARRNVSVHAARAHVNLFRNDCVRDNDLFVEKRTQP